MFEFERYQVLPKPNPSLKPPIKDPRPIPYVPPNDLKALKDPKPPRYVPPPAPDKY